MKRPRSHPTVGARLLMAKICSSTLTLAPESHENTAFGAGSSDRISTIESGRRNAFWACIGSPTKDAGFSGPLQRETLAAVRAAGVTRTPPVEKSNADIQSSPKGEISRREGPRWPLGADGKSRWQQRLRHTAQGPHNRAQRSQVRHRQRASHATALTGHGTLVKASLVRCYGRQDQWVSVAMSADWRAVLTPMRVNCGRVSSVWDLAAK